MVGLFLYRSLNPLLQSGFYADDMSNSLSWTSLLKDGASRFEMLASGSPSGPVPGRYYPLSNYAYFLFDFAHGSAFIYKTIILLCVITSLLLFALFIKEVFFRTDIAVISILVIPLFFQFRIFYDPITSFHTFMQVLFILLISSLILLNRYLLTGKPTYLVLSLFTYSSTLFLYEISYLFLPIMIYLIYKSTKHLREKAILVFWYCVPLSIAVLLTLRERSKFTSMPSYEINLNLTEYFPALLRQIYASFPLSYFLSNPGGIFTHDSQEIFNKISLTDLITIALFIVIVVYIFLEMDLLSFRSRKSTRAKYQKNRLSSKNRKSLLAEQISSKRFNDSNRRQMFLIGTMLLILPNMLIALSPTYQYLISWGIAHLPVYICYFGSFLILIAGVDKFMSKSQSHLKLLIAIVLITTISAGYAINLQNNRQVVETQNQTYWYKRNFLEMSQKQTNFLANLKSDSLLLYSVDDNLSLDVQPFLYSLTGVRAENIDTRRLIPWYKKFREGGNAKELKTENPDYWAKFGAAESELFSKYRNVFIIKYWSDSYSRGYVTFAEISNLVLEINDKATFVQTSSAKIFVLKADRRALKIEYRTFSCPGLSAACRSHLNYVGTLPGENISRSGGFLEYSFQPEVASKLISTWLDVKSIKIQGMDTEIYGP